MKLNANIIESKRSKMFTQIQNSLKARPTKDKHGNNMKKHLATYRYYIKRAPADGEPEEKKKMYITAQGVRLDGGAAIEASRME